MELVNTENKVMFNNCKDCKYYRHIEILNIDEGKCLDPNKLIIRRDAYGQSEYRPTVNEYKDGCKNFQS